jgi:patatin-like phospholipase/acyl hydrolase
MRELKQLSDIHGFPKLLVTSFDCTNTRYVVFDSSSTDEWIANAPIEDVLMATMAAPTYFPMYHSDDLKSTFLDGGLGAALMMQSCLHCEQQN